MSHGTVDSIKQSQLYRKTKNLLFKYPLVRQYLTDAKFNHLVNLGISAFSNLAFNLIRLGDGLVRGGIWEISLALYYVCLIILKTTLLWNFRYFDKDGEQKIYRRSGFLLLGLGFILIAMIAQMVVRPTGDAYNNSVMIYLVAFYSLYLVISALVGIIKYRKNKSPTLKVVKSVNFITASVSLLMLQTTILATFGVASPEIRMGMNGISGIVISIFVMFTAASLIVRSFNENKTKTSPNSDSNSNTEPQPSHK